MLLKANWNSCKKYKNKKIIVSKPTAGQKPSKVCSEVISFHFWKLQHQPDRETQTMGCGTTWDPGTKSCLGWELPKFLCSQLCLRCFGSHGDTDYRMDSAVLLPLLQRTPDSAMETHIQPQLPRQVNRELSVRKTSASEWDSYITATLLKLASFSELTFLRVDVEKTWLI